RRVVCTGRRDEEQRVTIGWSTHDCLGRDIARGSGPVIDDDLLAKSLRQEWINESRDDIGRNAGSIADDDPHRSRRIGLRVCDLAYTRERDGTCETQEVSTGKLHGDAPRA